MKTILHLTNPIRRTIKILSLVLASTLAFIPLQAQHTFNIDPAYTSNLGAGFFIPAYGVAAFTSNTNLLLHSLEGEDHRETDLKSFEGWPGWSELTAAFMLDQSHALLMNGNDYTILNIDDFTLVQPGTWTGLPENWGTRLDAVANYGSNMYMFIASTEFIIYNTETEEYQNHDDFTNWANWPTTWTDGIDAAVNDKDGNIYFFNGTEYLFWDLESGELGEVQSMNSSKNKNTGVAGGLRLPTMQTKNNASDSESRIVNETEIENNSQEEEEEEVEEESTSSINTDGWCLTGTPAGESDADLVASAVNLKGGGDGEAAEDDMPQGARVAEIRIWGSYIITGIQTVIETAEGETIELPILGKKEGRTNRIVLKPDECIIGIKGRHIGEAGNYVQSMQIKTSSRMSKNYGNKGKKAFNISIPDGTSFFGFKVKYADGYLTSIGVQYVGFDDGSVVAEEEEEEEIADETTTSNTSTTTKSKGEYRADFIDFIDNELTNLNFGATKGNLNRVPNIEWLGMGVDYLSLDPVNIGSSPTFTSPIEITSSNIRKGKGAFLIPYGTRFIPTDKGESMDQDKWITKYNDFTTTVGGSVAVSVGVPNVGGGSLSSSYKEMNNSKVGSNEIYYLRTIKREMYEVELKMKWSQRELVYDAEREKTVEGEKVKYRQKLNLEFEELIEALPVPSGSIKEPRNYVKGKSLPSDIQKFKDAYEEVIRNHGTHFTSKVTFGGAFYSKTIISKRDYEKTRQSEFAFKASAKAQIKKVEIGADAGFDYGTKSVNGVKQGTLKSKNYVTGANGITDKSEWSKQLVDSPSPMEVKLSGTYELLNKIYFPGDPDIEKKALLLKIITRQYLVNETLLPVDSRDDFFTKPKPFDVTYTLTVDNVTCTGVDSDEAGSANEFFGWVKASFIGPNGKTITAWEKDEDNAEDVHKDGMIPIGKEITVKIKSHKKGSFKVWGHIKEEDDGWTGGDDDLGKKSKTIDISQVSEEGSKFKVTGFVNGGDRAEINFTIVKMIIPTDF